MRTTATIYMLTGISIGTIMVTSSNSWMLAWLGLELNSFAILPLISKTKHPRSIEAATKYFLTQSTASCLILFASTINAWQTGTWTITQMPDKLPSTLMLIALTMKMGAAPMHLWLPEVMQGTTLLTSLLISTWQKIAPMVLIFTTSNHLPSNITLIMGLLSTYLGGWGGMNQTHLRKMMAFSSIANMGWTLMTLTSEPKMSMINIMTYMLLTTPTFILLAQTSTKTLQDMTTMWTTSPTSSITLTFLLLSMAGLPPLTGFMPKLLILNELISQNMTAISIATTMASLLSLIFYLRISYLTSLLNTPSSSTSTTKWRQNMNNLKMTQMAPTAVMSTTALPTLYP
uniref:NADH-ubiquinone oxidoreductase chain 2 n=1 Tax=Bronchocela cristatella TaxID=118090 RepID=A0A0G3VSG2_BROCR|nr:NADH dehydrogenase subunit 2 [Bronchocela cristatella]